MDDDALVALTADAVGGDRAAAGALLAHFRPAVVRYCRARLGRVAGTYDMADDVAQEVCIAVYTALPRYRDEGRPFAAFVFGVAAHKLADAWRASGRIPVPHQEIPDDVDPRPGPEQQAIVGDEVRRARDLLTRLPEQSRDVVLMRVVAGLSAEETGAALGMSPGAVRVTQHRALRRLRALAAEVVG